MLLYWIRTWLIVIAWLVLTALSVYAILVWVQPRGGFGD